MRKVLLLAATVASFLGTGSASAAMMDPSFVELDDSPIAEFRSNGQGNSWSIGTGVDTQLSSLSSNDQGSAVDWGSDDEGVGFDWSFDVSMTGVPTLEVTGPDGSTVSYAPGLTAEQRSAPNTLAIHAKAGVEFNFDFGALGMGTLLGDRDNRFGVDWAYLSLPAGGIDGLSGSGFIVFTDPIGNQSASGVTFKLGTLPRDVPEPASLALVGLGLLALGARRRARG